MKMEMNNVEKSIESILKISKNEPEFLAAVTEALEHLAATYSDKYNANDKAIDTKRILYHPIKGAAINPYQMSRYLQRFMTDGFEKSGKKIDLKKIIHYALFDMVRMNRIEYKNSINYISKADFDKINLSELDLIKPKPIKKIKEKPKKKLIVRKK